ncbi:hypothetical protein HDU67_010064 [Dinochytrium kinnereticum]|nr:hypothetical protein HDU67_010064 [Dinochytrium kinnereticum]
MKADRDDDEPGVNASDAEEGNDDDGLSDAFEEDEYGDEGENLAAGAFNSYDFLSDPYFLTTVGHHLLSTYPRPPPHLSPNHTTTSRVANRGSSTASQRNDRPPAALVLHQAKPEAEISKPTPESCILALSNIALKRSQKVLRQLRKVIVSSGVKVGRGNGATLDGGSTPDLLRSVESSLRMTELVLNIRKPVKAAVNGDGLALNDWGSTSTRSDISGCATGPLARRSLPFSPDILWMAVSYINNVDDLMNMALAGKAIGGPARERLWGFLRISRSSHHEMSMRLIKLLGLLNDSPTLGPLIKELELESPVKGASLANLKDDLDTPLSATRPTGWRWGEFDSGLAREVIQSLPSLQSLYLHLKIFTYHVPILSHRLETLLHLDLSDEGVNSATVLEARPHFPSLRELFLRDCSDLDHEAFAVLIDGCPNLRIVGINGCEKLTDRSLDHLARVCSSTLEAVAFGFRQHLTDRAVHSLVANCPALRAMYLDGHDTITERPILEWVQLRGSQISTIAITFCDITNRLLEAVAVECKNATALSFNGCGPLVTDEAVELIIMSCPKLGVLELDSNAGISKRLHNFVEKKFGNDVPSIAQEFLYYYRRSFL